MSRDSAGTRTGKDSPQGRVQVSPSTSAVHFLEGRISTGPGKGLGKAAFAWSLLAISLDIYARHNYLGYMATARAGTKCKW